MDERVNITIGERLKSLRQASGMNQMQVAQVLDIKRETYASWEIGRSSPKYDLLIKIAQLYNVSLEYLLTGEKQESFTVRSSNEYNSDIYSDSYVNELSPFEKTMLMKIRMLNLSDKQKLAEYIENLKTE